MSDTQPSTDQNAAGKKRKKVSKTEMRRQARSFALQALYQWHMSGSTLSDIEAQFHAEYDLQGSDTALFAELLHKIPAQLSELDGEIEPVIDRSLKDLDPIELCVLRIGTYELAKRPEVPYRVAINEAVNLAKIFGATDSHKYINGVLDKLAKKLRSAEVSAPRG